MAKATLATNFKDDILNSSMGSERKYKMTNNSDGTVTLKDVSTYDQVGSEYGASQVNAQNTAINASADASKIIDSLSTVNATTAKGYMAGALAVKELNSSVNKVKTYVGSDGKLHFVNASGADTALNFSKFSISNFLESGSRTTTSTTNGTYTETYTVPNDVSNILVIFPIYENTTRESDVSTLTSITVKTTKGTISTIKHSHAFSTQNSTAVGENVFTVSNCTGATISITHTMSVYKSRVWQIYSI